MKLRFMDGTERTVSTNPIEQKLFRNGQPSGWILNVSVSELTSEESNNILEAKNIKTMILVSDDGAEIAELSGYEKVSALTIRHTESQTIAEIQFSKGV
jgi:hypothetical protein